MIPGVVPQACKPAQGALAAAVNGALVELLRFGDVPGFLQHCRQATECVSVTEIGS